MPSTSAARLDHAVQLCHQLIVDKLGLHRRLSHVLERPVDICIPRCSVRVRQAGQRLRIVSSPPAQHGTITGVGSRDRYPLSRMLCSVGCGRKAITRSELGPRLDQEGKQKQNERECMDGCIATNTRTIRLSRNGRRVSPIDWKA